MEPAKRGSMVAQVDMSATMESGAPPRFNTNAGGSMRRASTVKNSLTHSLDFLLSKQAVTAKPPPRSQAVEDLHAMISELRGMLETEQQKCRDYEEALAEARQDSEENASQLQKKWRGELAEERSLRQQEYNSMLQKERETSASERCRLLGELDDARQDRDRSEELLEVERETFEYRSGRFERCLAAQEARIRRLASMESEDNSAELEAKTRKAQDDAKRWQLEAADLRLTVQALEDRCARQDQQNARLRTEVVSAKQMGSGSGEDRPPVIGARASDRSWARPPMARPPRGRGGGALGALAKVVEDEGDSKLEEKDAGGQGIEKTMTINPPAESQQKRSPSPRAAQAQVQESVQTPVHENAVKGGFGRGAGMSRNSSATLSEASTLLEPFTVARRAQTLGTASSAGTLLEQTMCFSDASTMLDGFEIARGLQAAESTLSLASESMPSTPCKVAPSGGPTDAKGGKGIAVAAGLRTQISSKEFRSEGGYPEALGRNSHATSVIGGRSAVAA
eukprot:CAMPEP_0178375900 /NCGR_PEP_ID=MMETSP0689_2-20121128/3128_1 /TAXON_ID=160604 /ORGANISM="Amphidinium massartii, Strain CS-259" /LENGTH=509 /DNA_ID=CAMNT_0019995911 /DNA_START=194 /DNA_END=1718 /DNA_ORIENTATION=+